MRALLPFSVVLGLVGCATGAGDIRSFRDITPAPTPALTTSPPCPEGAELLDGFHGGTLKGPLADVVASATHVLERCPTAWEPHELLGLVEHLRDHPDLASSHFMAAAADLRAPDPRALLAEVFEEALPVRMERAALALCDDLAQHHPDAFVRADAAQRAASLERDQGLDDHPRLEGLGLLEAWKIAGSFDNDQGKGFAVRYPPEDGVDLDEPMNGSVVPVRWRDIVMSPEHSVPLSNLVYPTEDSVAYLVTWLVSDSARDGQLVLSTNAPFRIFLNGRLVGEERKIDMWHSDGFAVPVSLRAGPNELLVKSAHEGGGWNLRARLVDVHGVAMAGVRSIRAGDDGRAPRVARDTSTAPARVEVLPAVAAKDTSPRANFWRARALQRAGLISDALESARRYQTASRDSVLSTYIVASLLRRNGESGKAIDLLDKTIGDDPALAPGYLVLDRARFWMSKKRWDAAQDDLKSILKRDPDARDALLALASVYGNRSWPVDRCRLVDDGLARWPDSGELHMEKAACLRQNTLVPDAIRELERAHALHPGDLDPIVDLEGIAATAARLDDAAAWVARIRSLDPAALRWQRTEAALARERHVPDLAKKALEAALRQSPDYPLAWEELGDLAHEAGDEKEALRLWREALKRNPKDSGLAVHTEFVSDEGLGVLARYAPTKSAIQGAIRAAAKKPAANGSTVVAIIDHEVAELYADGSSRTVVTSVLQAVNQAGRDKLITTRVPGGETKILAAYSLTPAGETQEASSIEGGTIRFRSLDVGSITVVQYLAHHRPARFLPNHYVSSWEFAGVQRDVRDATWILIAPRERALVRHIYGPVQETVVDEGAMRVRTYHAADVPPLLPEAHMPAPIDFIARVSVSTVQGWDEYVRWEQALIKDAFRSNPEVEATAQKIFAGAQTPQEKVDRAFRYVSKEIRYQQEYEDTIAGVKPHACPIVLERGYGDCKDKAVLLILLLKKAGVEADFALLRTTDEGKVEEDIPNQQFNHAIVYVRAQPGIEQGYFTDPTTDALDLGNLRADDQGATSLLLDPDGKAWRFEHIPYQAPELESSVTTIRMDPAAHTGHVEIALRGSDASRLRRRVRDAESEKKLLQAVSTDTWTGASLVDGKADTSEDLAKPFSLALNADIASALHDDVDGQRVDLPGFVSIASWVTLNERTFPARFGIHEVMRQEIDVAIPPGKKVLQSPASFRVEHACFVAERTTTLGPTSVHVTQSFRRTCEEIAPDAYVGFRDKVREMSNHDRDPLVLSR